MFENLTPFAAAWRPSMNLNDEDVASVAVAATYNMPSPTLSSPTPLSISDEQVPLPTADEYNGAPGASSLKWEGQGLGMRPGTDIYVNGHAWAPRGAAVGHVLASVQVGPCRLDAAVFGERSWKLGVNGYVPSSPEPFERMPLLYERCFGGTLPGASGYTALASDHNPVGRGIHAEPEHEPLPNIEDPLALLSSPGDRPLPRGFGPVARSWLPRRAFAGTYDESWVQERAPLWPRDIDARFFHAAAPGLQATTHLGGATPVHLIGLHPDGPIRFELPSPRLIAKFYMRDVVKRVILALDALMLEPDILRLTAIWQASVVARPGVLAVENIIVRTLEPWEVLDP